MHSATARWGAPDLSRATRLRSGVSHVVGLVLATTLAACALIPARDPPAPELPTGWNDAALDAASARLAADWWTQFGDPELDRLVAQALTANLDLALAAARVEEARATLAGSRAEQWPTLDVQADASRQRGASGAGSTGGASGASGSVRNAYGVAGVLGYELDLFGRLRSATEASRERLFDSTYTAEALRLTVITDVVSAYLDMRNAQRQLAITDETVVARQQALRVQEARLRLGADTELALRQAQAELASTQALAAGFRGTLGRSQTALAVLTGATPKALIEVKPLTGPPTISALPSTLPRVLPSELLARRPDIRAAEAALRAANADIGVARAQWFPVISLSALIGSDALRVGDLFTGPARSWSVGSSLVAPLFDFGRTRAQVDSAAARREQAEVLYRQTVQTAFSEVRDALTGLREAQVRAQAQREAVQALDRALSLATLQYRAGRGQYLDVLDAQRSLLSAQLDEASAGRDARVAAATLFKALGGGWAG
jgi:multidrug efflux system outer membrane protein